MKPASFIGYRHRRKAPCALVTVKIAHDPNVSIQAIDTWFDRHLDIRQAVAPFDPAIGHGPREHVVALADRALKLYGELLGASFLTCFEGGKVVGVEPLDERPGQFEVTLALEALDNVRTRVFTATFYEALRITQKVLGRDPDPATTEPVLQDIQTRVIDQVRKTSTLGYTSETLIDLLYRQQIPFRHIGWGTFRVGWGVNSGLINASMSERDSALGQGICNRKTWTAHFLRSAGYPVPDHFSVRSFEEAASAARTLGYPVVVKPNGRERSEGVTVNIADETALRTAYESALALDPQVLVEQQIAGTTYRIHVAGGKVIYAVKRNPKLVTGDGERTVSRLVEDLNRDAMTKPPWRRLTLWSLDEEVDRILARQGHHRGTVPPAGERVYLRDIPSNEWGGFVELVTADLHPDNVRLALDATSAVGLSICGVDLISQDISRPWHENGAMINELNFRPEFRWRDREEESARAPGTLVGNGGRVPIHIVCCDDEAFDHASALRERLASGGGRFHVTTADHSEDADGAPVPMWQDTLLDRSAALLMRPDLEGLILAGSAAEMLAGGFAVDRADCLHIAETDAGRARGIADDIALHIEISEFAFSAMNEPARL